MFQNNEDTIVTVPVSWKPYYREDLIRIGSAHDGGYIITKNALYNSDYLVSLGISTDWTFEKGFNELIKCKVHCYDHSINFKFFLKSSIKSITGSLFSSLVKINKKVVMLPVQYKRFFIKGKNHFIEKVGNNPEKETNFEKIFSRIPEDKKVFLKMDIEGSEYLVLGELDKFYHRISGIVIELHDVDTLYDSVHQHIDKLKEYFDIVHIHVNNYGKINADKIPDVLEVTFENKKIFSGKSRLSDFQYPILNLDSPNNKKIADYKISFNG